MRRVSKVDTVCQVGSLTLPNPVMTASGTAGVGTELGAYGDLCALGAVVVKSLSVEPWPGNPAPRVHEAGSAMINSVGLSGPGLHAWISKDLPDLKQSGARVVVSIWGRKIQDYAKAAEILGSVLSEPGCPIVAVEVNVSCPNIEDRSRMFAHSVSMTSEVVDASRCAVPLWVKLSPNVSNICEIANAALLAGAEGLTLVNTLLGLAVDVETRRMVLGAGGGGISGPPLHPVALRAVWECRQACPQAAIIGVGGICNAIDAIEMILAGADAIEVGTATFRDPKAPWKILSGLQRWCTRHGVSSISELKGAILV